MTNQINPIVSRPINSALRPIEGASIDAASHLPVSSFPSGAQLAHWDANRPASTSF